MNLSRRRALAVCAAAAGSGGLVWYARRGHEPMAGPQTRPQATDAGLEAFVRDTTEFGTTLLSELAADEPTGNAMLSPLSLTSALAMVWAGAREETERQIADTLEFPHEQDELHPTVGALLYDLDGRAEDAASPGLLDRLRGGRAFDLAVANALWGQERFPYRESFLETLETNYGASLRTVDFVGDPDGAREVVNDWAAAATDGRLEDLLSAQAVTEETRLVLTNAVTLLADWDEPFDPEDTTDEPFTALDGSTDEVATMTQTEDFPYARTGSGLQAVELPYVGQSVSMVVVLPPEGEFESFEDDLDADLLAELLADLSERELRLSLPRFEFEVGFDLRETLSRLGMPDAFDPEAAAFDGIVSADDAPDLHLTDVRHETYVAVDEEGTEAIAATGISGGLASGPADMTVDRPFYVLIRDRETNAPLFLGRIVDAAVAQ
ncbi:serpin family protein [Natrarchaeobaculum aegyptiacum]|uniref:Serpin domain-containing protein n=1 Tax=Natrarchaeobaculum aegyptiacum TaxID=745377 RepID=A0A2Z2HTC7_9EURY|nr:serpin family protein [Natrarchaeobaculum aegyptiacum]ARS90491.1 hypothetical protein B1756_12645 [Natrarchaeobaculum aegyptiacum]